jgi:hypothetical protein
VPARACWTAKEIGLSAGLSVGGNICGAGSRTASLTIVEAHALLCDALQSIAIVTAAAITTERAFISS